MIHDELLQMCMNVHVCLFTEYLSLPISDPFSLSSARMKFRAALANNDWMVSYGDVIILSDEKGGASSMAFRSMVSMAGDEQKQK